jgi:hypothetical protein
MIWKTINLYQRWERMKGGKRPGAGRKKGIPNRASASRQASIEASGLTPLEYMLTTMRDESKPETVRLDVAKAVAPYVHPRLASVEQAVQVDVQERPCITVTFVDPDGTRVESLSLERDGL